MSQHPRIGEKFVSTSQKLKYEIIDYKNNLNVSVRFEDGTILTNKAYRTVSNGGCKNLNYPSVFGVGFLGYGKYNTKYIYYSIWHEMLRRCYVKNYKQTYNECFVNNEWHNYQNFCNWAKNHWKQNFHLDKDILFKGNKEYSKEKCCFVPVKINSLLTKTNKLRGKYPIGVHYIDRDDIFTANLSIGTGKQKHLGCFNNPEDAFNCYKKHKEDYIKIIANKYRSEIEQNVYEALINYKVEITD